VFRLSDLLVYGGISLFSVIATAQAIIFNHGRLPFGYGA